MASLNKFKYALARPARPARPGLKREKFSSPGQTKYGFEKFYSYKFPMPDHEKKWRARYKFLDLTEVKKVVVSWNPLMPKALGRHLVTAVYGFKARHWKTEDSAKKCEIVNDMHEREETSNIAFHMNDENETVLKFNAHMISWPEIIVELHHWCDKVKFDRENGKSMDKWFEDIGRGSTFDLQSNINKSLDYRNYSNYHKAHRKPSKIPHMAMYDKIIHSMSLDGPQRSDNMSVEFPYEVVDKDGPVWPTPCAHYQFQEWVPITLRREKAGESLYMHDDVDPALMGGGDLEHMKLEEWDIMGDTERLGGYDDEDDTFMMEIGVEEGDYVKEAVT